jgi:hypothetical protein
MAINWSWPKATALSSIQSVSTTLVTFLVGHAFLEIPWIPALEASALAGVITALRSIGAYVAPSGLPTALLSASVSAAQDAAAGQAQAVIDAKPVVGDASEARG